MGHSRGVEDVAHYLEKAEKAPGENPVKALLLVAPTNAARMQHNKNIELNNATLGSLLA